MQNCLHIIKKSIVTIWNKIDAHSGSIQAVVGIIALVISTWAIIQTNVILRIQSEDSHTQYRAYMNVYQSSTDKVIFDDIHYYFPFVFENKGLTAAEKNRIRAYLKLANGEEFAIASTSDQQLYIVKDASTKFQIGIHKNDIERLSLVSRNSGNFLILDTEYTDFQNQKYLLRSKYVVQPPDIYNLGIYEVQETTLN